MNELFRFRSSHETMNADIILLLCPHLDLESLSSLAGAYPMFSSIVHKHLEKKKLEIELNLVSEVHCCDFAP